MRDKNQESGNKNQDSSPDNSEFHYAQHPASSIQNQASRIKMDDRERLLRYIQTVTGNGELPLSTKLTMLAKELSAYLKTEIYFCEIKGKRWSFVAGSDKTVYGSMRLQLNDNWGIISELDLIQNDDNQLIFNMIKDLITD